MKKERKKTAKIVGAFRVNAQGSHILLNGKMILLSIKLHNIIQEFTNKMFQILPSFK